MSRCSLDLQRFSHSLENSVSLFFILPNRCWNEVRVNNNAQKAKIVKISKKLLTNILGFDIINELSRTTQASEKKNKKVLDKAKCI